MSDLEKGSSSSATLTTPHSHRHHGHHSGGFIIHAGNRIKHFLHPDGRKIHVCEHPELEDSLRRRLSVINPEGQFDIVIHGSDDHIAALRESHAHHNDTRDQLKIEFGDKFEEFERIIHELDHLNHELHMVSEHAIQLDANFEKFGYSAHLRTLPKSGNESSASSLHGDDGSDHDEDHLSQAEHYKAAKKQGQSLVFFKRPVMRQYFHKGLLWRSQTLHEVASWELFVDLFYVGIIAIAGDAAAEHPSGEALVRFMITFTLSWKFWGDVSVYSSWFDADDILRRIMVLFTLTCLLGFTVNILNSWETTWTALVSFYIAPRWFGTLYFLWMSYLIPMVRGAMIATAVASFLPGILYIGSIHVAQPARQALIWPALVLDTFGSAIVITIMRDPKFLGKQFRAWSNRVFDFIPGQNIEHKIERTNAFVALVFGYSVIALLYQSAVEMPLNAFFGKAVLFLIIAFTYNWIYFEIDMWNLHTHAIRRHFISSLVWMSAHLPFIMGYVLAGAALSKIVLAHDVSDAEPEWLAEPFAGRSEAEVNQGWRWFFCGGLSVAMIMMTIIAKCHTYRTIPNVRLRKEYRIAYRFAVSIAMLLLPLAHDSLSSLALVGTCTGLVVSILLLEIRGSASSKEAFWGVSEFCQRKCGYSAKCSAARKEIEENLRSGKVVNVEELARQEKKNQDARLGMVI